MTKTAKYNPLLSLARQAKLMHMEMQCDPQWVLDLAAERDELRAALAATDKLASEAAQRNEDMGRALIRCKEWVYPPEGNCKCDSCADAAALLSAIDAAIQGGKP